jgi:hypothetical protein
MGLLLRTVVQQQFYSVKSVEDNSNEASRKTYFHLRLSIQYVKFLKKGISKIKYNFRATVYAESRRLTWKHH